MYLPVRNIQVSERPILTIHRIPKMAGGWGEDLMQDETTSLILDGA